MFSPDLGCPLPKTCFTAAASSVRTNSPLRYGPHLAIDGNEKHQADGYWAPRYLVGQWIKESNYFLFCCGVYFIGLLIQIDMKVVLMVSGVKVLTNDNPNGSNRINFVEVRESY